MNNIFAKEMVFLDLRTRSSKWYVYNNSYNFDYIMFFYHTFLNIEVF